MRYLRHDQRGGIAILFAVLAVPLIAMLGLAIDYAQLNQTYSAVHLAANSAALNAVKVAATGFVNNDTNYVAEAKAAGAAWSNAQIGTMASTLSNLQTQVTITSGTTITANVTISGQISSMFGKILGIRTYSVNASAQAVVNTSPYLEVVVLLDNSSSMAMGASITDMTTLLDNSPCDLSNEFTSTNGSSYTQASQNVYGDYRCTCL
jgi:Flp pilus assembly protein TadG